MSSSESTCPVTSAHQVPRGPANHAWWPEQLNLKILHPEHPDADPMGADFDYEEAFATLDLDELTRDVDAVMTDSQDWWPADFGHYGGLFIRMAWHSAGTYRVTDGRGGGGAAAQRFAPLNSWPDNVSLDKARRLLWPVKKKYGRAISWADLMIFTGNRALETMGLRTFGFAGGRRDIWAPEEDTSWGPEQEWLGDERYSGDRELHGNLAAVQMGLIYVNPEGPNGTPDPIAAAHDIRETFSRMAMNDEETVALIAGGHTFGKAHGAHHEDSLGSEPEGAGLHEMGFGWTGSEGEGTGADAVTSGLEGSWTTTPTQWSNDYYRLMFKYDWELTHSPAGAQQWTPKGDVDEADMVPDAHREGVTHPPMMFTTDLSMKEDPAYRAISERFANDNGAFAEAFARAWYKLTHRDMGPIDRYLGPLVPGEELLWQDPVPAVDHDLVDDAAVAELKGAVLDSDLTISQLVTTAWSSAATYRRTDMRGGANGAHIRLSPQIDWDVNVRSGVGGVLSTLEGIEADFNEGRSDNMRISLADLIVLAGSAAVEAAAKAGGHDVTVPFTPGRTDASQEQTDVESFGYLEPMADGFRNYLQKDGEIPSEHLLVDKAFMLNLSAPEMTALVAGLRVLGANVGDADHGILTDRVGTLSNDFFTNLLDMGTEWEPVGEADDLFEGRDRHTGEKQWDATRIDLLFGSNPQLRAISEVYGSNDGADDFVETFVQGWTKVMDNDRFDVA